MINQGQHRYLEELPHCDRCGRAATKVLRNGYNAPLGRYCDRCGQAELKREQRALAAREEVQG